MNQQNNSLKCEYSDIYKDRIHISERVNAYLKGLTGYVSCKRTQFQSCKNTNNTNLLTTQYRMF